VEPDALVLGRVLWQLGHARFASIAMQRAVSLLVATREHWGNMVPLFLVKGYFTPPLAMLSGAR